VEVVEEVGMVDLVEDIPVVLVSSSSLTHHNKYIKNHNGF
jgi:hypothetical protein